MGAIDEFKSEIILTDRGQDITNGLAYEKHDCDVQYFSKNRIAKLLKSPQHYEWQYIYGHQDPDTASKKLGNLTDWALLQPKEFKRRYVIKPAFKGKGARTAAKDWLKALPNDALIMDEKEAQKITDMITALHRKPEAVKLLSNGIPHVHMYYRDTEFALNDGSGVLWYGILDFLRVGGWIVEVKTTKNAEWWAFERDAYEYKYHVQTYLYKRGMEGITKQNLKVAIIAIENKPPYCVEIYFPTVDWYETAYNDIGTALRKYNKCMETGIWYGYNETPKQLGIPAFARFRMEDEYE